MDDATGSASSDRSPTRRWILVAGAASVLSAGLGVGAEFFHDRRAVHRTSVPRPPAVLLAAVEAERHLIADLDATTGGTPAARQVIVQARSDHLAHLRVLHGVVASYGGQRSRSLPVRGVPRTLAQLRIAEQQASVASARRADALTGAHAALLASIAACEATHAVLFT